MLRKILLSTALVAAAGSAVAADLPYRTSAPAPYVTAAPIFTWTGFYVGLNAGAAFNNGNGGVATTVNTLVNPIYGIASTGGHKSGFTGGVTAGYNMQFGSFVAGVEGDINYLDRNHNGTVGVFPVAPATAGTDFLVSRGGNSNNYFGTLRARLGFAIDRFLVFGTGGLAFGGSGNNSGSVLQRDYAIAPGVPNIHALPGSGGSNSNVGWALGGGVEYAFTNAWTIKAEYLHVSLGGNHNTTFVTTSGAPQNPAYAGGQFISINNSNKFDVVRAGLNYRF